MDSSLRITDIELTTLDDDKYLFEIKDATICADYLHNLEVREVAIKMGERGCMIFPPEHQVMTPTTPHKPIDTTGADGSFNLAYLAQRSDAKEPEFTASFANGFSPHRHYAPRSCVPRNPHSREKSVIQLLS